VTLQLKHFLLQYADLSDGELEAITAQFKKRHIKKNEFLLRQGEICKDLVFVQQGCLRMYYISEDVEVSVWFNFDCSSAIDLYSFISERPSEYFFQAIEDTQVLSLPKRKLDKLYDAYPKMQQVIRNFWEDAIIHLLDRFTALQKNSAVKRYEDLLAKQEYMQRIPQKYLASFIGVTPTSLSRIRRKFK
jgi:CRP-like cAMP-binding protein